MKGRKMGRYYTGDIEGKFWFGVQDSTDADYFGVQGEPRFYLYYFSEDDKNQLLTLLQPGDIILTYSEGFMSNIFLPGIFKHGIVYTGRRENWDQSDWDKIDITDHQKSLIQVKDNIIEAIAEGVVSGPLEEILDTKKILGEWMYDVNFVKINE